MWLRSCLDLNYASMNIRIGFIYSQKKLRLSNFADLPEYARLLSRYVSKLSVCDHCKDSVLTAHLY